MSTIGLILARGGSKGLPNKNAAILAGKPVLAWTIEHALATGEFNRVVLSTDSDVMARIATGYGVDVILRPRHLCSDTASIADAARFSVKADEAGMLHYDHVAILYGNVPVRPFDLTSRALAMLAETGCDSVQSVTPVGKHHPYWMKTVGETGELGAFIENTIDRRQDLPSVYELDGGIIALTRDSLFTLDRSHPHTFLGHDRRAIVTQPGDVIDIDCKLDLQLAEVVLREQMSVNAEVVAEAASVAA